MDISIDIETLSLTNRACILSIGACVFDIETGKVKNSFYVSLDRDVNSTSRFDISKDTVEWWEKQSDEAKAALEVNKVDPRRAIEQLIAWVHQMMKYERSPQSNRIWANDPQFDLAILGYAFHVYGHKIPWRFYEERSFRTIVDLAETITGISKDQFRIMPKVAHSAVDDAIAQAQTISQAYRLLKGQRNALGF